MPTPHLYSATYALIFNDEGKVLLNQRQNTNYYDGGRTLIAGHIEQGEIAHEAMIREIKEECGLHVELHHISPHHVIHRLCDDREYFDISFVVHERNGTPIITEPEKCIAIDRFALDELPQLMPPENFVLIEAYLADEKGFSTLNLRTN